MADLENERKRFKTREGERAERSVRAVIESLLPVIDNFERAIAHGEGGEGVALVFKQLASVLEAEGVVEIPAQGTEFDPNVHEAVESRVQAGLEVPTVIEVHRRAYTLGGQLLRAALVVVGRPEEAEEVQE
ncbi:MAG: nucleotide exchange factor GrpE [Actinomycetota bacterium]|nr:nucleotide exchange factor GrpE [Actinomycetota bacterium]